jgi:phage shock protein PspC (stress-responsive transcriptional regulator)
MEKRLYRNEHNKTIAGVSAGLADYVQIDITVVKLLFVLTTIFLAGTGLLAYIIMWIILPVNNDPGLRYNEFNDYFKKDQQNSAFNTSNSFENQTNTAGQTKWNTPNVGSDFKDYNTPNQFKKNNETSRTIGGLILLVIGVYFLLKQFVDLPEWFNIFKIYKLWPLAIVAVGISLIFRNQRKSEWDNFKKTTEEAQKTTPEMPVEEVITTDEDKDLTVPKP